MANDPIRFPKLSVHTVGHRIERADGEEVINLYLSIDLAVQSQVHGPLDNKVRGTHQHVGNITVHYSESPCAVIEIETSTPICLPSTAASRANSSIDSWSRATNHPALSASS